MYTRGRFMSMCGKTNTVLQSKKIIIIIKSTHTKIHKINLKNKDIFHLTQYIQKKRGMGKISGKLGAEGVMGYSRRIAFAKVHRGENKVIRLIRTLITIFKKLAQSNSDQN